MTNLELDYLKSEAGQKAYKEHCLDSDSRLEILVLKNQITNPFFGALASLIKLRRAAKNKFRVCLCQLNCFFQAIGKQMVVAYDHFFFLIIKSRELRDHQSES